MEPRVSIVTLGMRDLERARRFYRDSLGWPTSSASVAGVVVFLRGAGLVLGLWSRDALAADADVPAAGPSSPGQGFAGIALAHNVRAHAAGATLIRAAAEAPCGGYSGYFADPDSHLWKVAWNPGWPLDAAGHVQLPE
ncbi:MAG: VOC family protein [Chloroflexi bacterium]|nr:VOC family protein [Chloroflexota bacterium]